MRRVTLFLCIVSAMLVAPAAAQAVTVPASIPSDCSVNVNQQLSDFIASVPDGSTIDFPTNGCYAQNARIEVRDKSNITIDAHGSTFRSSAENSGCTNQPNWMILRGQGVTLKNAKIVGNFDPAPNVERTQANAINAATSCRNGNQFNMGVSIYGGRDIRIQDSDIRKVYGDGVLTASAWIIAGQEGQALDEPTNIDLERLTIARTARHSVAPTRGVNVWITDSRLSDSWYWAIDAELDNSAHKLSGLHILRNTIRDYFMGGVAVPVAGDGTNTTDIEIKHNVFETAPDNYCNDIILVGGYDTVDRTLTNVRVDNNTMLVRSGVGVRFDHVVGGSIQNNKDAGYVNRGCGYYDPAMSAFTRLTNSSGVTIANNGPNSPGADATAPQPPVGCVAPTGLDATRLANNGGYTNTTLSFNPVPSATEYHVYLQWSGTGGSLYHYQTFPSHTGTVWSLQAARGYDIAVKAKCGSQTSAMSAVLYLPPA